MQDPVKRLEAKYDRLVASGAMTNRREELMMRRMRQLTTKATVYSKRSLPRKYKARPSAVKNPRIAEHINRQHDAWHTARFKADI